jgi:glyoxylase-like metal-dependent hydrolase (beta-lactamase superfamily II)
MFSISRTPLYLTISLSLMGVFLSAAEAQTWTLPQIGVPEGEVQVLHVKGNVYMLVGSGGNIAAQVGPGGVLMVDTGTAAMADEVLAALKTITSEPVRYIVNTSYPTDYTGGNEPIAASGRLALPFRGSGSSSVQGQFGGDKASVISYYTVFHQMAAPLDEAMLREEGAWPDNTFSTPLKRLYFNDEPVIIMHQPSTTDGNSVVLFRKSDVLVAGAVMNLDTYPVIEVDAGGSIQAVIESLNRLIDMAVPAERSEGGTMVIPGRGRISDFAELAQQRDMMAIIRDRVQDMLGKGMSLDDVIEARPTEGFDARHGSDRGPWTTEMFVEAVYRSLAE